MYFSKPFSEECIDALNEAVSYLLHVSHVYLGMAYGLIVDRKMPTFAQFFEREADTKRRLADLFVQVLGKLKYRICRPDHGDLKMTKTDTPIDTLLIAQELEGGVTEALELLIEISVADQHSDLSRLFEPLLEAQKKNEDFLKFQLHYQQTKERLEPFDSAKPSTSSGAGI